MTQKDLAELVGVRRQTMNGIENCRSVPTIDVAIRIADVFGITVDQLFDLDIAVDPTEATDEDSIKIEGEDGLAEKEAEHEFSLASLRNVIG